MNIDDIITFVAVEIYSYYMLYFKNNTYKVDDNAIRFISKMVKEVYIQLYDDTPIENVDVLCGAFEETYSLMEPDIDLGKIFLDIDNKINEYLKVYSKIWGYNRYHPNEIILSLNTCPFEGLYITHNDILYILKLYNESW